MKITKKELRAVNEVGDLLEAGVQELKADQMIARKFNINRKRLTTVADYVSEMRIH